MTLFRLIIPLVIAASLLSCKTKKDIQSTRTFEQRTTDQSIFTMFREADSIVISVERYLPSNHDQEPQAATDPPKSYTVAADQTAATSIPEKKSYQIQGAKQAQSSSAKQAQSSGINTQPAPDTKIKATIFGPKSIATQQNAVETSTAAAATEKETTAKQSDGSLKWFAAVIMLTLALLLMLRQLYAKIKKEDEITPK